MDTSLLPTVEFLAAAIGSATASAAAGARPCAPVPAQLSTAASRSSAKTMTPADLIGSTLLQHLFGVTSGGGTIISEADQQKQQQSLAIANLLADQNALLSLALASSAGNLPLRGYQNPHQIATAIPPLVPPFPNLLQHDPIAAALIAQHLAQQQQQQESAIRNGSPAQIPAAFLPSAAPTLTEILSSSNEKTLFPARQTSEGIPSQTSAPTEIVQQIQRLLQAQQQQQSTGTVGGEASLIATPLNGVENLLLAAQKMPELMSSTPTKTEVALPPPPSRQNQRQRQQAGGNDSSPSPKKARIASNATPPTTINEGSGFLEAARPESFSVGGGTLANGQGDEESTGILQQLAAVACCKLQQQQQQQTTRLGPTQLETGYNSPPPPALLQENNLNYSAQNSPVSTVTTETGGGRRFSFLSTCSGGSAASTVGGTSSSTTASSLGGPTAGNGKNLQRTPQRKPPAPIPEEKKDDAYYERRRKNNDAAKKSRDTRRQKEEETAKRAAALEQENIQLRQQIENMKAEVARCQALASMLLGGNPPSLLQNGDLKTVEKMSFTGASSMLSGAREMGLPPASRIKAIQASPTSTVQDPHIVVDIGTMLTTGSIIVGNNAEEDLDQTMIGDDAQTGDTVAPSIDQPFKTEVSGANSGFGNHIDEDSSFIAKEERRNTNLNLFASIDGDPQSSAEEVANINGSGCRTDDQQKQISIASKMNGVGPRRQLIFSLDDGIKQESD